jgi:Putative prokaryotic signal transducing protein
MWPQVQAKQGIRAGIEVVAASPDPVRISFLAALLRDAGIACAVLDAHISAVEGGIGAFPRRLAVSRDDAEAARRVLREAGEAPAG